MKIENINENLSVSGQIQSEDVLTLADMGVEVIICNRPDGEDEEQPPFSEVKSAAENAGVKAVLIDFKSGKLTQEHTAEFSKVLASYNKVHAFCRTGSRSKTIYEGVNILLTKNTVNVGGNKFDVVIIGAGSGGISTAASLAKRNRKLSIGIIEPSEDHYYQPGWTMVGGGIFDAKSTHRKTKDLIPSGVSWIRNAVTSFSPSENAVILQDGSAINYEQLVVAPGLTLNWSGVEGLEDTLGKNGVTSNYRYDLAPYTWELVQGMKKGKALFTQPPMPIKCAGAPQKALYLSASEWFKRNKLEDISIDFYNAGGVLFGVDSYVPALMSYIKKYKANLVFSHTLTKVDGESKTAWFKTTDAEGLENTVETKFDFLHVCPPQCAPEFIRDSELSDSSGWLDVDPASLQHKKFANIWGVGDVMNTTNAKTMAAARKQAPVVAQNIANAFAKKDVLVSYDGYGSCPLTVERGKVVLAEFTYGGKLAPSFPSWFNNGTKPTLFSWILKANMLPFIYWNAMLKGREWMASPK
jgi:sulfide:quinone oxidoreductase